MKFEDLHQFLTGFCHIRQSMSRVTRDNSMVRQRRDLNKTPAPKGNGNLVIPDDEQWRLVKESGLLNTIDTASPKPTTEEPDEYSLVDEAFDAALLVIPFSFLLFMMDMSVSCQSFVSLCLIFSCIKSDSLPICQRTSLSGARWKAVNKGS